MRIFKMRLLLACLVCLCSIPLNRGAERLNLFIWSEYMPAEVAGKFEARFQCKLVIDLFEEAEAMLAKIQAGGASIYDVAVVPDYLVPAFLKLNLAAPLRHQNIPNLKNLEAQFLNLPFDPENKFTAAYQWGTVGIYARKIAGQELDQSWALFFDPGKQPGNIVLIDSMRDLIGAALKYQGQSYNTTDPAHLKPARDLLLQTKKRASAFAGSVGGKTKVLDKSAAAAIVYSGEGARGMSEDSETVYFIPKEGAQIWLDNLVVLAKAPNRALAEKFINFVLDPEIGAEISNFTQFSSPNKAARPFIKKELLDNPAIYPPGEILKKLEFLQDLGKGTRVYDQVWTQIKAR